MAAPLGHARRHAARAACVVAVLAALLVPPPLSAQAPPPELTGPVNDFAGVISPEATAAIDELSRRLLAASGDTLVVATVRNTEGWGDIRSYATKMFENGGRGLGQKGRDNGLLLLLAVDDRKVWVEVGYDLEGFVTDGFAGETSREVMVPFFRDGQFGEGLHAGAARIAAKIAEGRRVSLDVPAGPEPPASSEEPSGLGILIVLLVVFVVLPRIMRQSGVATRGWRGGAGPWGGGPVGGGWSSGGSWGGGFGGFGGGRSGGGGGGASW